MQRTDSPPSAVLAHHHHSIEEEQNTTTERRRRRGQGDSSGELVEEGDLFFAERRKTHQQTKRTTMMYQSSPTTEWRQKRNSLMSKPAPAPEDLAISATTRSCLMPMGLVMAEAMVSRSAAPGVWCWRTWTMSAVLVSLGTCKTTLKTSMSSRSRSVECGRDVVHMTRSRRSSSVGTFLRRTSNVWRTVLEKRGPMGVYSMRRSTSSMTSKDRGDL
mmetsp:Transcript_12216/g.36848  ORF Transcript_12216/g.36848 Transcript_12216/m.36848 type:complete len:216 (-) Transcript_12216:1943-2590(-)